MTLGLEPNLSDPDGIYGKLVELQIQHRPEDWPLVSSRLLLILINHIGDDDVLLAAFEWAGALNGD